MPTLDEHIAQSLRESQRNGELQSAQGYGQPIDFGDAYEQTPPELRLAFKMLKDAGYVPPEVETMKELAVLRARAEATTDEQEAQALRKRVSDLQQHLALRLEKLRISGSL